MRGETNACLGDRASRIDVQIDELLPGRNPNGGDRTFCIALSRDDARAFTGREDGWLFSWPLEPSSGIKRAHVGASIERMLLVDDDNLVLLTGDGSITVLDVADLHLITKRDEAHSRGIFAGAFDTRGSLLFTGGLDGRVKSWRFPSLDPVASNDPSKHGVLSLAIGQCPDGPLLLAGNARGGIASYEPDALSKTGSFKGHDGPVFSIKFFPGGVCHRNGGAAFLSAGSDGVVAAWKVGALEPLIEVRSGQAKLLDVLPVQGQGGGLTVWTASSDGSIGAWLLAPGNQGGTRAEQLACLQAHGRAVEQLVACSRARQVLSVASDGSVLRLRT
ncbi:MAG: hypothetical protein JW839_21925 [Candidatus Lokiarchaeota archaeon]|nr:hypothetical protein [Candidatus Lokiarchaeota archaeon]